MCIYASDMVDQILIAVFSSTHDILNASQVHKEKGLFCVTLKEFGLKMIPNVLAFEKFTERNNFAKLKSLSSLFRISRTKKILFRDHPRKALRLRFHQNYVAPFGSGSETLI
jgi:hypothetical protein